MKEFDTLVIALRFNAFSHQKLLSVQIILPLFFFFFKKRIHFTTLWFSTVQFTPSVLTSKTALAEQKGVTLLGYD